MTKHHAVFMMVYNTTAAQLELTIQAIDSVLAQDIGNLDFYIVNNGSDGVTSKYLSDRWQDKREFFLVTLADNSSPLKIANFWTREIFKDYEKILGVPNDVILPPNLYRLMDEWPRGFVTASMTGERGFRMFDKATAVNECTPMAVMLTRRWAYEALVAKDGYFLDEGFFHYASDCDLALRMAACGIHGIQLDVEYYHYGSASWRMAIPEVAQQITRQADIDRAYFSSKWGFPVEDELYGKCCGDINFRGIVRK